MTHRPGRRSRMTLAIAWIAVAVASTSACSRHGKELQVSPPLPPAEEPSDDVKGAFVGDAGAPRD